MTDKIRTYYVCWYRLDGVDRYLIWYSDSVTSNDDGVYLDGTRRAPSFDSIADTLRFAESVGLAITPEDPVRHHMDTVAEWLTAPRAEGIDCRDFLAAWNLFADVAHTVAVDFLGDDDETLDIYDKLFYGNNLPAFTPAGEQLLAGLG